MSIGSSGAKLPVKLSKFKALFAILGAVSPFFCGAFAQSLPLNDEQRIWIAERIFANECNRQISCLTSWNQGEDFPSLGIGHFIWYRQDQQGIYTESFPALLRYMQARGITLPGWLQSDEDPDSPWPDRAQFLAEIDSPRTHQLREFLTHTQAIQAAFIIERQSRALPRILASAPAYQRATLEALYQALLNEAPPYGAYALIDYVNFKGEGTSPDERYQGQGWGLLQVLQQMQASDPAQPVLNRFATAARLVLERRIANAPPGRDEDRWQVGWMNRIQTYIPPPPP